MTGLVVTAKSSSPTFAILALVVVAIALKFLPIEDMTDHNMGVTPAQMYNERNQNCSVFTCGGTGCRRLSHEEMALRAASARQARSSAKQSGTSSGGIVPPQPPLPIVSEATRENVPEATGKQRAKRAKVAAEASTRSLATGMQQREPERAAQLFSKVPVHFTFGLVEQEGSTCKFAGGEGNRAYRAMDLDRTSPFTSGGGRHGSDLTVRSLSGTTDPGTDISKFSKSEREFYKKYGIFKYSCGLGKRGAYPTRDPGSVCRFIGDVTFRRRREPPSSGSFVWKQKVKAVASVPMGVGIMESARLFRVSIGM